MRRLLSALAVGAIACSSAVSDSQKATVRAEVEATLRAAYDLSKPDVAQRMLSLYGTSGPIVSASAGRVVTSRNPARGCGDDRPRGAIQRKHALCDVWLGQVVRGPQRRLDLGAHSGLL